MFLIVRNNIETRESTKSCSYLFFIQEELVVSEVGKAVAGDKLDAVLNVAGGWAGGNASSAEFIKNCDMMWKQSVWSSTIAAAVAAKHSKPGGCLVLPGAQPATAGTPGTYTELRMLGQFKRPGHDLVLCILLAWISCSFHKEITISDNNT